MRWISSTAIGSTPANGSSSRMKRGLVASARAISTRRRSPPDSDSAGLSRRCAICSSSSSASSALVMASFEAACRFVRLQFEHRADVLLDRQLAEDRRFLRQVGQARAARAGGSAVRQIVVPSSAMSPASAAPGRRSCRTTSSCRRRSGRAARRPRRSSRRATRPSRPCATRSASSDCGRRASYSFHRSASRWAMAGCVHCCGVP